LAGGEVSGDGAGGATGASNLICYPRKLVRRACAENHAGAFGGKQAGNGFANALPGAGDERHLAFEALSAGSLKRAPAHVRPLMYLVM
jgi:hypothetical protein